MKILFFVLGLLFVMGVSPQANAKNNIPDGMLVSEDGRAGWPCLWVGDLCHGFKADGKQHDLPELSEISIMLDPNTMQLTVINRTGASFEYDGMCLRDNHSVWSCTGKPE